MAELETEKTQAPIQNEKTRGPTLLAKSPMRMKEGIETTTRAMGMRLVITGTIIAVETEIQWMPHREHPTAIPLTAASEDRMDKVEVHLDWFLRVSSPTLTQPINNEMFAIANGCWTKWLTINVSRETASPKTTANGNSNNSCGNANAKFANNKTFRHETNRIRGPAIKTRKSIRRKTKTGKDNSRFAMPTNCEASNGNNKS